jgi:flagellin-like hook-associated protein FlgL
MSDVTLTAAIRSNLLSLRSTTGKMETTTERLATGKKVSSAVDNPTNYFAAEGYNERADGLSARLDGMGEAIQTINAADNGITTLKGFLSQMKGVANDALGETDSSARADLGEQFNELMNQAQKMIEDASYGGINLLNSNSTTEGKADTLTVEFNEKIGESKLDVKGVDIESGGYSANGFFTNAAGAEGNNSNYAFSITTDSGTASSIGIKSYGTGSDAWASNWQTETSYKTTLDTVVGQIEDMESELSNQASKLANNLAVITQREDFTNEHINILQEGADNLTLADMNEEGANLLSLQTSQSLGIQSLSLASQQGQAVLQIIG